jgi:hypothetical protein
LTGTKIDVISHLAESPTIVFEGDWQNLTAHSDEINFNGNLIYGDLLIKDLTKKTSTIQGDFRSDKVDLNGFYHRLSGNGSADLQIRGKLSRPTVSGQAHCAELIVGKQQIRNIDADVKFSRKGIRFDLTNAFWYDHKFFGEGDFFFNKTFEFDLQTNHFQWYYHDLVVEGSAQAEILYQKKFIIHAQANDLLIRHPRFTLENVQIFGNLDDSKYRIEGIHPLEQIHFLGEGDFDETVFKAKLDFKKFQLDSFFSAYSLPSLSGFLEVNSNPQKFIASSSLRLYDKAFGKLDGRFTIDLLRDFAKDSSSLRVETHNMKFNYEDFHFVLNASGTADSLRSTSCKINDEIALSAWLKIRPQLDYGLTLNATKISIPDYLKYIWNDYTARKFTGKATMMMEFDSHEDKNIAGVVKVEKFRYGEMKELEADLQFYGSRSFIAVPQFSIFSQDTQLIGLEGDVILQPEVSIKAVGNITNVELSSVFPEGNVKGLINGDFLFVHQNDDFAADLDITAKKLNLFGIEADSLMLVASQKKKRIDIVQFLMEKRKKYKMESSGSLGYTFWNSKTYQDTNKVNFKFNGDLLNLVSNYFSGIQSAESNTSISLKIGMGENGLSINEGFVRLNKAQIKLKNQVELVDKIVMNWDIENNALHVKDWRFRMGEGRFYITNEIDYDEEDFVLGMLNLGKFYARTNERGLLVHVPGFMPFNSVVKAEITGRIDDKFKIIGPFDDMKFIGDIYVSNGGIMYPPEMDNILKLFGKIAEEKKEKEIFTSYPFTLDIMFRVKDNLRYVTYPANILVTEGNYLHLQYYDDAFHFDNAIFSSKEGSVNIFGTDLEVEQIDVQMNPYFKGVHINGLLYKRAVDGTIITMEVFHNPTEKQTSFLQFRLYSDNPDDGTLDVLAKLRYNRSMDDISDEEKKTLLQDEVVQFAGLGLESAILDPLIYPLENQIRRLLRLDMFHVQTGIIRNFFNRYYFEREEEKNYLLREELDNITEFGSEMFLNNLTITMGKYVTRKLFFMYETKFEKPTDVAITSKLGINHSFSLRYDLPKRYKLAYRYKIFPFDEKDSHEIALERSFRFW